jgi:DNA-binding transcriptional regulator YdaS (Cro superfamily)
MSVPGGTLQQDYFGVGVLSGALDIVGGAFALAEHLGVQEREISEWLAFRKPIPWQAAITVAEIIVPSLLERIFRHRVLPYYFSAASPSSR